MWAGSRISADGAPLKVGDCVTRESTIAAIKDKTGTSGDLIFISSTAPDFLRTWSVAD